MESIYWKRLVVPDKAIVIIGAGLVGLTAALHLKRMDPVSTVILLERGAMPNGASIRNAGFVCFGSVGELEAGLKAHSVSDIKALVKLRYAGIRKLFMKIAPAKIDYEACGGFELLSPEPNLKAKVDFWNDQLANVFEDKPFRIVPNTFGFKGMEKLIYHRFEGALNPGKLVRTLVAACYAEGVEIYWNTPVQEIEANRFKVGDSWHIAYKILLCTNGYSKKLLPDAAPTPYRNEVFVTNRIPGLSQKLTGTFHYDAGYMYFRTIEDRLLVGGARNKFLNTQTDTHQNTKEAENYLYSFVQKHILREVDFQFDYKWSGILGYTSAAIPKVKQIEKDIFTAVGMNGMGVALSSWLGEEAAEKILV